MHMHTQHITDPHIASASLDVAINNPLSQEQDVSFYIKHALVAPSLFGHALFDGRAPGTGSFWTMSFGR